MSSPACADPRLFQLHYTVDLPGVADEVGGRDLELRPPLPPFLIAFLSFFAFFFGFSFTTRF